MNYVIVEDERYNAELLASYVQKIIPEATLSKVLPSVQESVAWFSSQPSPDLVFMDIRLEDGLCFEIFQHIQFSVPVIFTTAYDEYALQAFKVYGAAYLLKPIMKSELQEALGKLLVQKKEETTIDIQAMIALLQNSQKMYKEQYLIHYKDTLKIIPTTQLDYIYLEYKSTYFCLLDGTKIAVPYTLDELEQQLNPNQFFRVNRQYIISMDSIEAIYKYFNDKAKVVLKRNKDAEIIVSRSRMLLFKTWLDH